MRPLYLRQLLAEATLFFKCLGSRRSGQVIFIFAQGFFFTNFKKTGGRAGKCIPSGPFFFNYRISNNKKTGRPADAGAKLFFKIRCPFM